MSAKLSKEKSKLIADIAKSQGYNEYTLTRTLGSTKGDGYSGTIEALRIEDKNYLEPPLHLVLKSATVDEAFRRNSPLTEAYNREVFLYDTIFAEIHTLFDELGVKQPFAEKPKYYGSSLAPYEECLVLEDIRESNFTLWNRKLPMNEEHVALVFTTYAKLHGNGLVLKYLRPDRFQEFSKILTNLFHGENETEADKQRFAATAKNVFGHGFRAVSSNPQATQALTKCAQSYAIFFLDIVRKKNKFATVIHGDCWCNNMMFKYEDAERAKPTQVCLLDWQLSQVGSPVMDLSFFLYTSGSKVLNDLKKFLRIYHENLSNVLQSAGLNPDDVLTYEELEEEWKTCSKYGLFMSLCTMTIVLSDSDEAPDLSELAKSGKNLLESFATSSTKNQEELDKRLSDVIVFMMENDYL